MHMYMVEEAMHRGICFPDLYIYINYNKNPN